MNKNQYIQIRTERSRGGFWKLCFLLAAGTTPSRSFLGCASRLSPSRCCTGMYQRGRSRCVAPAWPKRKDSPGTWADRAVRQGRDNISTRLLGAHQGLEMHACTDSTIGPIFLHLWWNELFSKCSRKYKERKINVHYYLIPVQEVLENKIMKEYKNLRNVILLFLRCASFW